MELDLFIFSTRTKIFLNDYPTPSFICRATDPWCTVFICRIILNGNSIYSLFSLISEILLPEMPSVVGGLVLQVLFSLLCAGIYSFSALHYGF